MKVSIARCLDCDEVLRGPFLLEGQDRVYIISKYDARAHIGHTLESLKEGVIRVQ